MVRVCDLSRKTLFLWPQLSPCFSSSSHVNGNHTKEVPNEIANVIGCRHIWQVLHTILGLSSETLWSTVKRINPGSSRRCWFEKKKLNKRFMVISIADKIPSLVIFLLSMPTIHLLWIPFSYKCEEWNVSY